MCTFQRARPFIDSMTVDYVRAELLRTGKSYSVEEIAYCFMPDHLHALIEGIAEDSDLLKYTKMFRQRSGHSYRALTGRRLWQEGYVDQFLRAEEATLDVARYIVGNPVRAGLCDDLREYPYLGSSRYAIEELIVSLA
jgi:putative transposase